MTTHAPAAHVEDAGMPEDPSTYYDEIALA
jgi:hypothetical protein